MSFLSDVTALDVSPAGDAALVGEKNGDVVAVSLDGAKARTPAAVAHHAGPVLAVSRGRGAIENATWSVGEDRVATLSAGGVSRSIDVATPAFAWIERRNALALVGRSGVVQVISLETLEPIGELKSPDHPIHALASDALGEWLFAGSRDGALQGFDLDQGTIAVTEGPQVPLPSACALSPDGDAVACASAGRASVRVLAHSAGVPRPPSALTLSQKQSPDHLALEPAGKALFLLTQGAVARDDEASPALPGQGRSLGDGQVALLASVSAVLTNDTSLVVAGAGDDGRPAIGVFPFALDARPPPVVLPSRPTALAWSDGSRELFVASADRHVRRIDGSSGAVRADVSLEAEIAPEDAISTLASTDDGKGLAVGTRAGKILVGSPAGAIFHELASLRSPIGCTRWARSGRALVVSADHSAFVVSTDVGMAFSFWTAPAPIVQCARSPEEDRFSFVGEDGTAWVKAFDLSGVSESYVPPDPADPDAMPTLAKWKGLPVGLVR